MKRNGLWIVALLAVGFFVWRSGQLLHSVFAAETETAGTTYEAQKATALANPYANDFGPKEIDVSSYPPEIQETYRKYLQADNFGCQRCHTAARPLNSQFVEPSGPKDQEGAKV